MGTDYSFYVKTVETHARAFLTLNILAIGTVMYLLTARHKLIDVLTHLPKDFRHAKSHLVSANVQRKVAVIVTKNWICTKIRYTLLVYRASK